MTRIRLTEALHARPANLLVRLAGRFDAVVRVTRGDRGADACRILEVLALGAAKGDEVEIRAHGTAAEEALRAVVELIEGGFSSDLVPEAGAAAVEGIAIGAALLWILDEAAAEARAEASLEAAFAKATRDVQALMATLPAKEAKLFEPEIPILEELFARVDLRVRAGEAPAAAVLAETAQAPTDLILDARSRVLEALGGGEPLETRIAAREGEIVFVTDALTPSVVALLPPRVVGIIAGSDDGGHGAGFTSHAAILARGRQVPLAYVPHHVIGEIEDAALVVLDTTSAPASVWTSPSAALVETARTRKAEREAAREAEERAASAPLTHLGVEVRVNVSSLEDRVPEGAEGIGLVRTELVFAGRKGAPSEEEQVAALRAIAAKARGGPTVARLFDAGGDKPLEWLAPPQDRPDARGVELLFAHPGVLAAQVRAIARADVRALLPLVRGPEDVDRVRELAPRPIAIGAMIETAGAAEDVRAIARASDFVCVGTNDLTAEVRGEGRAEASFAIDPRVVRLVQRIVEGSHAEGRKVTVCGEIAGDPEGAKILVGLGVDALSVAPGKLAKVRAALAASTRDACAQAAETAMTSIDAR